MNRSRGHWAGVGLSGAFALILLSALPGIAGIPSGLEEGIKKAVPDEPGRTELRQTLETMSVAGYPGEAATGLLEVAGDLSRAGISIHDICCKVREGVAKKAESGRVMAVVADRAGKLKDGRVLVLDLSSEGTVFLDQQMAFRVVADYLARGIPAPELRKRVLARSLGDFPALENLIR